MTLSVSRLLDIGLNVDTSGLESFLSQIRDRLDGLQDRIADLENEDSSEVLSESDVEDIAERVIRNSDLADSDHNHDFYDQISDQVYDMVKDVVREDLDEKDFADRDHDHDGSYASVDDFNDLAEKVGEIETLVKAVDDLVGSREDGDQRYDERLVALEHRVEALDQRLTDAIGENSLHGLVERIESLEADRSEHLRLIQDLQESSSGATRFFKLAVQMLDIVRESVGR